MQFERGDVVLLTFPFTASGGKQRPALVLLDAGDDDILVARVTTHPSASRFDYTIANWSAAGLLAPSTVRLHKLASIEKALVRKRLGRLGKSDWDSALSILKTILSQ